ncbi:MAG: T9SS type A sorting domain-containing protein [Bacteroidales bacterium]|nr:T9SS type A sorting domain-containing protein [Bacteroidales bacterium]
MSKSGVYDKVQVEVYNMHGKKVVQGELIGEKKHEFRTSDLPHGLYFVTVVADDDVETFKLVKTK